MKKLVLIAVTLCLTTLFSTAQQIEVTDVRKDMSQGNQWGLQVDINSASMKDVEKDWIKMLENGVRSKVTRGNNEIMLFDAKIQGVNDSLNIYSSLLEYSDKVQVNAFFHIPSGFVTAQNEFEYLSAKKFLREFAQEVYKELKEDEIDDQESVIKDLEKDLKKLIKANDKIHKDINSEEREIERTKDQLRINDGERELVRRQIIQQKDKMLSLQNEDLRKIEEKQLKSLEKDLSKLEKTNDKANKKIDKCEANIRSLRRELQKSQDAITRKENEVQEQKQQLRHMESIFEDLK